MSRLGGPYNSGVRGLQATVMRVVLRVVMPMVLVVVLSLGMLSLTPAAAQAGPVEWQEVAATSEGRQWWDVGSLRNNRAGNLTVLSRFQPTGSPDQPQSQRGDLYVMEIDCDQALFRDTSINGLPQFGASWQPSAGDGLIAEVIAASCAAAPSRSPQSPS